MQIHQELLKLVAEGRAMQPYRRNDLDSARACGQKMRVNQKKIAVLQEQVDSLPSADERIWLGTAIFHTGICCSCRDRALSDCKEAGKELAHPEKHVL